MSSIIVYTFQKYGKQWPKTSEKSPRGHDFAYSWGSSMGPTKIKLHEPRFFCLLVKAI